MVSKKVKEKICQQVYEAFGGQAYEVIVGGAPLSKEVEQFLFNIGFPITVGYGTTECAPLISYNDWKEHVTGSCGKALDNMEVRILSNDPQNVAGEIVTRGTNLMLGYFKNEEATRQVIDEEGWYHTGDLATRWMLTETSSFAAASRTCCWEPMVRMSILRKLRTN